MTASCWLRPIGAIPAIAARLARAVFEPDLLLIDGEATLVRGTWPVGTAPTGPVEGWLPYRAVFDLVWRGRRHIMMGPSQIDRFGNANISCIGDFAKPKVQLLGVRGAPGNTVNHPVSYWVPRHSPRVFVEQVDMVSGVGYDRAARLPAPAASSTCAGWSATSGSSTSAPRTGGCGWPRSTPG